MIQWWGLEWSRVLRCVISFSPSVSMTLIVNLGFGYFTFYACNYLLLKFDWWMYAIEVVLDNTCLRSLEPNFSSFSRQNPSEKNLRKWLRPSFGPFEPKQHTVDNISLHPNFWVYNHHFISDSINRDIYTLTGLHYPQSPLFT